MDYRFPFILTCTFSLLLILQSEWSYAQYDVEDFRFTNLSVEHGLPAGNVHAIEQDYLGYIWVGTGAGLARYDGYSIKNYKSIAQDTSGLNISSIRAVYEAPDSSLFIGTMDGLYLFNRDLDQLERIDHARNDSSSISDFKVFTLHATSDSMLWVGTLGGGLNKYNPSTGEFTRFLADAEDPGSLSNDWVLEIEEDDAGKLWISTLGGVNILDPQSDTFSHLYHDPQNSNSIRSDSVDHILVDKNKQVWIGTWGSGVSVLDPETNSFTHYKNDPQDPRSLSNNFVEYIHQDSQGRIWIATLLGLNIFNPVSQSFDLIVGETEEQHSFFGCCAFTILEDRSGTMWFGMVGVGINHLVKDRQKFQVYESIPSDTTTINNNVVVSYHEDFSGDLWIGTVQGINYLDEATNTFQSFVPYPEAHPSSGQNQVWAFTQGDPDHLWIATFRGGISRFHIPSKTFTSYRHDPIDSTSLSSNSAWAIHHDSKDNLWVGTSRGLDVYDPMTDSFDRIRHDPNDPSSLNANDIQDIFEDDEQRLWVATFTGLNLYHPDTHSFTRFLLPDRCGDEIFEAYPDDNTLWLGVAPGQLCTFDMQAHTYERHLEDVWAAQSTPDNILRDASGNLWLGTYRGLIKYHIKSGETTLYDRGDGLIGLSFFGHPLKREDGTMYFSSSDGAVSFHPDRIKNDTIPPHVVINDVKIFQESVSIASSGPLKAAPSVANHMELSHWQNQVGFEYAGIHFREPEKNQYAHMLEGYEEEWVHTGTQRSATYTNLDPGTYTFRVKAANSDGTWNESGASLAFTIHPPWWSTVWAYGTYAFLLLIGFVSFDRFRKERIIAKERQQAQVREAQLETKAAQALSREATALARERESEAKALEAENERKQLEIEKGKELEKSYRELQRALTHLRETQDQLIHTEKMASLGQLTAGVAHEIKNPLNFVTNFAKLSVGLTEEVEGVLKKYQETLETADAHELKSLLDDLKLNATKINEHGHRADGIIRSMLEHSRANPGEKRPVDINELLDEYVNLSYHAVRAKTDGDEVTITRDYADDLPEIPIVPQEIGRVFINLLDNAFYAINEKQSLHGSRIKSGTTDEGAPGHYQPEVKVSTSTNGKSVEIKIADNGTGISKEIQSKIFEPFFTTKPTGSGTGLGLSLSYDIVTKGHGGALMLESQEGEGATFKITLPSHL